MERLQNAPSYILNHLLYETYKPKETILFQGDTNEFLYFIESGKVEVSTLSAGGQKISISIYETGGSLGVLELFDTQIKSQTVIALTECKLVKVHKDYILKWMKEDFEFNLYIISLLQECFVEASYFSRNLMSYRLKDRVILSIHKYYSNNQLKYLTKDILVTETGTQKRSLNRIIKELIEEELIEYKNKKITILDSKNLENIVKNIT